MNAVPLGSTLASAVGKGLALFPRKVHGRYVALSRSDRESNAIAYSDDMRCWPTAEQIQTPTQPWELLQLGNCGSPIETDAGWLAITHGVGPMRTYALGVLLLDLDEPEHVLATGYGALKDDMVRVGHMGEHTLGEVQAVLEALGDVLSL